MPSSYADDEPSSSAAPIQFSASHNTLFPSTNLDFSNDEGDNADIPGALDLDKDDDDDVNLSAGAM